MNEIKPSAFAKWTTALLVVVTFILITTGGVVTSQNAGLAVPDWPTSFGWWFFLPFRLWADLGVFLEHSHRQTGAIAGLVAIATYFAVGRTYKWSSKLGLLAALVLILYIVQGVMGGIRVTEKSVPLAIVHGVHGQLVLALTVILATLVHRPFRSTHKAGRIAAWGLVGLVIFQLLLGATIRHTNSASAIPDAPLVYGKLMAPNSQEEIDKLFYEYGGDEFRVYVEEPVPKPNAAASDQSPKILQSTPTRPATPPKVGYVHIQWMHRAIGMLLIPIAAVILGYRLTRDRASLAAAKGPLHWGVLLWMVQVILGLSVIWSRERWEIATGHQAVGALFLAVATWLAIRLHCGPTITPETTAQPASQTP